MWTPDYFVRLVELPASVEGVTVPNDDGSFDIYINSRLGEERRRAKLEHELEHIRRDHFYRPGTVAMKEAEAGGVLVTRAEAPEEAAPPGMKYIPVYPNLESFVADFAKRAEPRSLELLRRAGWKGGERLIRPLSASPPFPSPLWRAARP